MPASRRRSAPRWTRTSNACARPRARRRTRRRTDVADGTEKDATERLLAVLDPHAPLWRAIEDWAHERRLAIATGLLSSGSESVETARGKAAILRELMQLGENKRVELETKGDFTDGG